MLCVLIDFYRSFMDFKVALYCVVFWISCCGFQLLAQHEQVISRYYSMKDGLSHDAVLCLVQDNKGFLWIGTYAGLNKFDGYNFTAYLENPLDSNGLVSNSINSLWADQYERLWVGTISGLQLFDLTTEKFSHLEVDSGGRFHMQTNRIRPRKDGKLWLCTSQGIYIADPQTLSITSVINSGRDDDSNSYFDIAEANDGTIWAASEEGLVHLNLATGEAMRYVHDANDSRSGIKHCQKRLLIPKQVWQDPTSLELFNSRSVFDHFLTANTKYQTNVKCRQRQKTMEILDCYTPGSIVLS